MSIQRVQVNMSEELKEELEEIARREQRKLSPQIVYFLKQAVAADKAQRGTADTAPAATETR